MTNTVETHCNASLQPPNITNNTLHVTSVGTVLVQASIANGKAIGTDYTQEFYITANTVGIVETHCNASPRVYPNPSTGELHIIGGHAPLWEDAVIEIYSVVGQNVGAYPCGRPETIIDISHLTNGLYFLKIENQVIKFIKE